MASINGISLRNAKTFEGRHEIPLAKGDVYYKGKKLGSWSQDYSGGEDDYGFSEHLLDDELKKYREAKGCRFAGLGLLLEELFNLQDIEKAFKTAQKEGFSSIVVISTPWNDTILKCRTDEKDLALYIAKNTIEEIKKKVKKPEDLNVVVYTSLDDFKIKY